MFQVDPVQLGYPVLSPDFKLGPSLLHFYHTSQVDSREHNLCPITKQKLILKILDMIKFTLLNTKITFLTYIDVSKVLSMIWYLTLLSRTSENSRSNRNSKFSFFNYPVHWAVTFSKNQTFINVFLQNTQKIWSNSFLGYLCRATTVQGTESLPFFLWHLS